MQNQTETLYFIKKILLKSMSRSVRPRLMLNFNLRYHILYLWPDLGSCDAFCTLMAQLLTMSHSLVIFTDLQVDCRCARVNHVSDYAIYQYLQVKCKLFRFKFFDLNVQANRYKFLWLSIMCVVLNSVFKNYSDFGNILKKYTIHM